MTEIAVDAEGRTNIKIPAGATLDLLIQLTDDQLDGVDITTFSWSLKVVDDPAEQNDIFYEMNESNGRISPLSVPDGIVRVVLDRSETLNLPFEVEDYVLEATLPSGNTRRLLTGKIRVT